MLRYYIIPTVFIASRSYLVPKYLHHRFSLGLIGLENVHWTWQTQSLGTLALAVADVDVTQHALLNGQPDVLPCPIDRSTALVASEKNWFDQYLEGAGIPAEMVQIGESWRVVLARLLDFFEAYRAMVGAMGNALLAGGRTLADTLGVLTLRERQALFTALDTLNIRRDDLAADMTLRQCLLTIQARRTTQRGGRSQRLLGEDI